MRSLKTGLLVVLVVGAVGWGCGKLPDSSGPDPIPENPGPGAPAPAPPVGGANPQPTPTPILGSPSSAPTPDPGGDDDPSDDPTPDPSPPPPESSGCGAPTPAEIARMNVKVHLRGPSAWTLDATPLVGPDAGYCALIGFTDGRQFCPVRPEGHPEREACETFAVGIAQDTGRAGPTWRRDGSLCRGAPSCENHPENQYFVKAIASGRYEACPRSGGCGSMDVAR